MEQTFIGRGLQGFWMRLRLRLWLRLSVVWWVVRNRERSVKIGE